MTGTRSKFTGKRGTADAADLAVYAKLMAQDNGQEVDQLRRNLAMALREDVTPRQRQVLLLYYGQGMSMKEIAQELGIDRSTVSRTMGRGEERLRRCLRYGGAALLKKAPLQKGERRKRGVDERPSWVG
ncbi:MAG: sigma-70 family RNA polymerase sigma factor [Ruminiclostridium sp.]|nr:sigma-70 family RNA polymerase sigma factor [Ruminiclostridium sp.]